VLTKDHPPTNKIAHERCCACPTLGLGGSKGIPGADSRGGSLGGSPGGILGKDRSGGDPWERNLRVPCGGLLAGPPWGRGSVEGIRASRRDPWGGSPWGDPLGEIKRKKPWTTCTSGAGHQTLQRGIPRDYPPRGEPLGFERWGRGLGEKGIGTKPEEWGRGPRAGERDKSTNKIAHEGDCVRPH
jgi:hypothetical protein